MSARFFVLCVVLAAPCGGVVATAAAVGGERDAVDLGLDHAGDQPTEGDVAAECAPGAAEDGQCAQSPTAMMQQHLAIHRRIQQHRADTAPSSNSSPCEGKHKEEAEEELEEGEDEEEDEEEDEGKNVQAVGAPVIASSGSSGDDCGITIKQVTDIASVRMCLMSGPCKDMSKQGAEWTGCPAGIADEDESVTFQLRQPAGDDVVEVECECPGAWPWSSGKECTCEDSFPTGVSKTSIPAGWRRLCTPTAQPGSGLCAIVRTGAS